MTKGNFYTAKSRNYKRSIFDQLILVLIVFLSALPFSQVFFLRLGFVTIDAYELIWIALCVVLTLKIVAAGKLKYPGVLLSFLITSFIYIFYSALKYEITIGDCLRQLRFYMPFIVAWLLLASKTFVPFDKYSKWIISATIISSLSALFFSYVYPDFLRHALASSEEVTEIVLTHGRLYWTNSCLTFFMALFLMAHNVDIPKRKVLLAFLISFAAMFNTFNRTVIIGMLLFMLGYLVSEKGLIRKFKKLFLISGIILLAVIVIILASHIDERIIKLIQLRYLGYGDINNVYYHALEQRRYPLYAQYLYSLKEYFPLGQGLGRPFSIHFTGEPIYTSDISLISFVLPFGVFGFAIFSFFSYKLYSLIGSLKNTKWAKESHLIALMLTVFLLMSLNIDFFSRNNFVIYFVVLLLSLRNSFYQRRYGERINCENVSP